MSPAMTRPPLLSSLRVPLSYSLSVFHPKKRVGALFLSRPAHMDNSFATRVFRCAVMVRFFALAFGELTTSSSAHTHNPFSVRFLFRRPPRRRLLGRGGPVGWCGCFVFVYCSGRAEEIRLFVVVKGGSETFTHEALSTALLVSMELGF